MDLAEKIEELLKDDHMDQQAATPSSSSASQRSSNASPPSKTSSSARDWSVHGADPPTCASLAKLLYGGAITIALFGPLHAAGIR
jgi:hypothetical protein